MLGLICLYRHSKGGSTWFRTHTAGASLSTCRHDRHGPDSGQLSEGIACLLTPGLAKKADATGVAITVRPKEKLNKVGITSVPAERSFSSAVDVVPQEAQRVHPEEHQPNVCLY